MKSLNADRASFLDRALAFVSGLFDAAGLTLPDEAKNFEFILSYPPSQSTSTKRDDKTEAVTMVTHPWEYLPSALITREDGTTVGRITSDPPQVCLSPIFPYHALAISDAAARVADGKGTEWDAFIASGVTEQTPLGDGKGATYQLLGAMIISRLYIQAYHAADLVNGRVKAKAEKLSGQLGVSNVQMVDGLGLLLREKVKTFISKHGTFPGCEVDVIRGETPAAPLQSVVMTFKLEDGSVHTVRAHVPKFAPKPKKDEQKAPSDLVTLLALAPGAILMAVNIIEKKVKAVKVKAEAPAVDVADLAQVAA